MQNVVRDRTAIILGDVAAVRSILKSDPGAVDAREHGSFTPRHHGAASPDRKSTPVEIASMLLTAGADIEAKDDAGRTPLHWAAIRGRDDVAALLISHKAVVSATDGEGKTPLDWAIEKKEDGVADVLRAN